MGTKLDFAVGDVNESGITPAQLSTVPNQFN